MIDDKLAFVHGLDLTCSHRDTPEHAVANPHRRDVNGQPYQLFHDVHTMFDGRRRARHRAACARDA